MYGDCLSNILQFLSILSASRWARKVAAYEGLNITLAAQIKVKGSWLFLLMICSQSTASSLVLVERDHCSDESFI